MAADWRAIGGNPESIMIGLAVVRSHEAAASLDPLISPEDGRLPPVPSAVAANDVASSAYAQDASPKVYRNVMDASP